MLHQAMQKPTMQTMSSIPAVCHTQAHYQEAALPLSWLPFPSSAIPQSPSLLSPSLLHRHKMAAAASSAASSSATPMQTDKGSLPGLLPWVEKYRPVTLDDVSSLGLAEDERREGGREVVPSYTPCERIASFFLVHAIKTGHGIT